MSHPAASGVDWDRDGPVATVTLRRPEVRNAQTPQMWGALRAVGRDLPADVRVVVVRGAGPAFSAGLDRAAAPAVMHDLAGLDATRADETLAGFQEAFDWLRRPDLITIAAVRGPAVGAGFQLALACDLRVLAEDAQFAMAEVTLGLVPDLTGTRRLVELVGYSRALEICVTGRRIGAREAARIGLATMVVAAGDLDHAVGDLAAAVLAGDRDAVIEIKALLAGALARDPAAARAAERQASLRRIADLTGAGE